MMTSADKVGGWVKKGQNHDDVMLEWSFTQINYLRVAPSSHNRFLNAFKRTKD